MRANGMRGVTRGKAFRTTRPDVTAPRPPDLVGRDFHASKPERAMGRGLHLRARPGRGWRSPRSSPTCSPGGSSAGAPRPGCPPSCPWTPWRWPCGPEPATGAGPSTGLVHHSDAGVQYTSIRYTERLADAGALASIGTVGDSYDNALAESLIGLYKTECVRWEGPWRGVDDLELATLNWVHWFNDDPAALRHRRHPSDRVRGRVLPSDQHPTATAAGRTRPPLNPGRFSEDHGVARGGPGGLDGVGGDSVVVGDLAPCVPLGFMVHRFPPAW